MSGYDKCDKQYTYKPLTRLGRRKKRRYWNGYIDDIMSDKIQRTSTRLHEEMLTYVETKRKEEGVAYSGKNLPSVRQVASYLHYSQKYEKTTQPRRGPHNKWEWVIKSDI